MDHNNETEFRLLNEKDEKAYETFIREFLDARERIIPANSFCHNLTFSDWLQKTRDIAKGQNLPANWVPSTLYFLLRKSDGKILGAIDIRHTLNDFLQNFGGNIGYGIAPSERRQGYADYMLKQALQICKDMGMEKILITCDAENVGSQKVIEKNGGIFENELVNPKGEKKKRFWIDI